MLIRSCLLAMTLTIALSAQSAGTFGPRLTASMQRGAPESIRAWVYFTDKGPGVSTASVLPSSVVSERSLRRRAKVLPSLITTEDLPVNGRYRTEVASRVSIIRQQSRWFNAVSVIATASQLADVAQLPFVREIELPGTYGTAQPALELERPATPEEPAPSSPTTLDYGASLAQVSQINVVAVHDLGYSGAGVVVGVIDNGFRLLTHQAFDSLRNRIIATYDFVDHKVSVVPNNPSSSFGAHGVNTLSTIGGYRPGQLIGPAYGASYILARTENDSSETPVEEDNWVAAIEWADSIGVDVTSCSLGYLTYDLPYASWTWENMDGNTTVITRAADMAVARGIVVVNSAGNEGPNTSHNTLIAPADGDSVLSIGAVTSTGARSSFSSVGPTTSNPARIKPDVMARGSSVRAASATNPTGYSSVSGTSFSCPLTAGVVALILEARPNATPKQIGDALRATASQASNPDNQMGWGIVNALDAISEIPLPIQLHYLAATSLPQNGGVQVEWGTLTEVNNYGFEVQRAPSGSVAFETLPNGFIQGHGTTTEPQTYSFVDAEGVAGQRYRLRQIDFDGTVHLTDPVEAQLPTGVSPAATPLAFALQQNYPNPFNPTTTIRFQIAHPGFVSLKVYDRLGRDVATLADGVLPAGEHTRVLDASGFASGVYYYRLVAGGNEATRAFVLMK